MRNFDLVVAENPTSQAQQRNVQFARHPTTIRKLEGFHNAQ